jgi:hypothetical protein
MSEYKLAKVLPDSTIEYSSADHNLQNVKNIIYEKENPNPLTITLLILIVLLFIYFVYILFIKINISGIWFGNILNLPNSIKYTISHNTFLDTLTIKWNRGKVNGKLIGRTIILYNNLKNEMAGVLINRNKIKWLDSNDIWNNVRALE